MYIGFELKKKKKSFKADFEHYFAIGEKEFKDFKTKIKSTLKEFINENGSLNGDKMQSAWFPKINADIFLSHSHDDEDLAIAFAGWLKNKFDLNVFIDSCIWSHSKDLQEIIDKGNRVTWTDTKGNGWIDYEKVQYSTSHVNMMLNTALIQMIDVCECIIFVNTPNSVKPSEIVDKVVSPWIYSELAMIKFVRKKELKEYRIQQLLESDRSFSDKLNIEYNLDTDHLIKLSFDDLNNWVRKFKSSTVNMNNTLTEKKALDFLYELKEVNQV